MATIAEQLEQELLRVQADRNTIRAKLVELNLAVSTDTLNRLATVISDIVNRGTVNATVREGETCSLEPGYYAGGSVAGIAGGGNYSLQEKTVTPTKKSTTVTSDTGYYGLSQVVVNPIPSNYQDVSDVTATAPDVLLGKVIVLSDGTVKAGTMPNIGTVTKTLNTSTVKYTIAAGYHSGTGTVTITLEEKSVTPTKSTQVVTPTSGKVLSKVTVNPIPSNYITTDDATAAAGTILDGETAYVNGVKVEGEMPNNGAISKTLTPVDKSFTIPEGYHDGTGKVQIVTEGKEVVPTKDIQVITPSNGKTLSTVTIAAIGSKYQDVTPVTAVAAHVLDGDIFVNKSGSQVEGTMPNNGAMNKTFNPLTQSSVSIPAGYTSGGSVTLTEDLLNALKAI